MPMQEDARFAGLWPRFVALLVDFLFFCAVFLPATRLLKGVWMMSATDHRWNYGLFVTDPLCIAFLVVMVVYRGTGGARGRREARACQGLASERVEDS